MNDTPAERGAESTWARLRRRKVVQWGLVYLAAAWGFLQGLEYVGESFHWPEQLRQIAIIALLIGLPVVLVLAWYHGDRGQQRVTTPEFAILTLLLLLGGGSFWYYQRANETPSAATTTAQPAAPAAPLETAAPDEKSIAVLPFADMSAKKDQEYMSDGMAEELLNLLAKVPDLKVIARTSSFAFKGEKIEIAEIAKKLNVAHVLEGSVRTAGNKVRITAQLVRASDSTHLWSETYDRPLDDIFAVQDEIADAVAQALQIKFAGGTLNRNEGGTQNLAAYQLYLRAWNGEDWNSQSSLKNAQGLLERAIDLDPDFGIAWSALAAVYRVAAENGYLPASEGFERARELIQHALQLSPDSTYAHASLLAIYLSYDWDWSAAEKEARRALALDPTDPGVLRHTARLSLILGRWEEAEQRLRAALDRDPLDPYSIYNLGLTYYHSGRLAEAEAASRSLLEISPGFSWARSLLGAVLLAQGSANQALQVVQLDSDDAMRLTMLPIVLHAVGRKADAEAALQAQIDEWEDTGAFFIAQTYAFRGEHDKAMHWLERAYNQKDAALIKIVGEPLLKGMADDPRYKAFLRKMKLPESAPPASEPKGQGATA